MLEKNLRTLNTRHNAVERFHRSFVMLRIGCGIDFVGATRPPPVSCRDPWTQSIYASLSHLESKKCESLWKYAAKMPSCKCIFMHFIHSLWFYLSKYDLAFCMAAYKTPWDVSLAKTCMSTHVVRKSMSTHPWPFICSMFLGWVALNGSSFPLWWITCLNGRDRQQTRWEWDWWEKTHERIKEFKKWE